MPDVRITEVSRSGNDVVVRGTANASPVTCRLIEAGAVLETQVVAPNAAGNWTVTFLNRTAARYTVRASAGATNIHEVEVDFSAATKLDIQWNNGTVDLHGTGAAIAAVAVALLKANRPVDNDAPAVAGGAWDTQFIGLNQVDNYDLSALPGP